MSAEPKEKADLIAFRCACGATAFSYVATSAPDHFVFNCSDDECRRVWNIEYAGRRKIAESRVVEATPLRRVL